MYEKNCGLDNVLMSWGHDEYLYQVDHLIFITLLLLSITKSI